MNNLEEPRSPWPIRQRTDAERIEWSRRGVETNRSRIRSRRLWAVGIWAWTFGAVLTLLALPRGATGAAGNYEPCSAVLAASASACTGQHIQTIGQSVLIGFLGLAVGTFVLAPSHRNIIPRS